MSLEAIGAALAVLVMVFLVSRAWYAIVEGLLGRLKRLFGRRETDAWHTLPPERQKEGNKRD